jgi:hypothetical protein
MKIVGHHHIVFSKGFNIHFGTIGDDWDRLLGYDLDGSSKDVPGYHP